jgi:hypothetical protein
MARAIPYLWVLFAERTLHVFQRLLLTAPVAQVVESSVRLPVLAGARAIAVVGRVAVLEAERAGD